MMLNCDDNMSEKNDDSDNHHLPIEVIIHIMSYLSLNDRIAAGLVNHQWYEASLCPKFLNSQMIKINREKDNLELVLEILSRSQRPFYHFLFQDIELKKNFPIWSKFGSFIRSLIMVNCNLSEKTLINILKCCKNLRSLHINACKECLMSGRLLDDAKDIEELSNNFESLVELSLASNRYLSDALFNRLVSMCPNLQSLSLTDCQISFHFGVYKKFYPSSSSNEIVINQASGSLLTFVNILNYIRKRSKVIKHLSLSSTLLDSSALSDLSNVENLKLETLKLSYCDQLTNNGLRSIINQMNLKVLDISFCTRITDASLLCICQSLINIEVLLIKRCRAVTNYGISYISLLKHLKELDISECDQLTGECITDGLYSQSIDGFKSKSEHLEVLLANGLNLDEKSVECIADLYPKLRTLDLGYCFSAVTDKTIKKVFKQLRFLRILRINNCDKVSDAGLIGMDSDNSSSNVVNSSFKFDSNSSPLKIRLGSKAEEEIVRDARRKKKVTEICEDVNSPVDLTGLFGYSLIRLTGLRELNLTGCNKVTDVSLKHAFMFPELQILDLSSCQQITHVGLDYLTRNNPAIEHLNLSQCHNVTDLGIDFVAQRLHRLKRLHINNCSQLTNATINSIRTHCKSLQLLDIRSCPKISDIHLETMRNVHVQHSESSVFRDAPFPPQLPTF